MRAAAHDLRLTVEQFLAWDDPDLGRYELEDGLLVAMAPPSKVHGTLAQNVGEVINAELRSRRPCRAIQGAGVVVSREPARVYVPDVVMTCEPLDETPEVQAPVLVVEVLSPSTKGIDELQKVPAYAELPSVQEIWLVGSQARSVLVWRRVERTWIANLPYRGGTSFPSPVLGTEVGLDRLYELTGL